MDPHCECLTSSQNQSRLPESPVSLRIKVNPSQIVMEAVQDAVLYVELNAVRAGLANRPEQWKWGSARWRRLGKDEDLIPLEELFPSVPGTDVYGGYRARLYYRGAVPTKDNQAAITQWILQQEERRGFARAGAFRRRLRFLTDGLAVGPAEKVAQLLEAYRQQGAGHARRGPREGAVEPQAGSGGG